MWAGVTRGFAGVKLSGSLRVYGSFRVSTVNIIKVIKNSTMSFTVKYWWNGILSVFLFNPNGLFDVGIAGRRVDMPIHTIQHAKRMNVCCRITIHEDSHFNQRF
jgi:hypothetical protein